MGKEENLSGMKFGRWNVSNETNRKNGRVFWRCVCDCGEERFVLAQSLKNGRSRSCGCLNRELASKRMSEYVAKQNSGKRFLKKSSLYQSWRNMMCRVFDEKVWCYYRYGGRGITVCDAWRDYDNFAQWSIENGFKKGLTLDRINNDGNYSPDNCRWVSRTVQANNTSTNRVISYHGKTMTLAEVARATGKPYSLVKSRVNRGMDLDAPVREAKKFLVDGKRFTIPELQKIYGFKYSVIANRLKKGIPLDAPLDMSKSIKRKKTFASNTGEPNA